MSLPERANGRKRRVLAFLLADRRPRTVLEIAHGSGCGVLRAGGLYGLLHRYAQCGLVSRELRQRESRSGPRQVAAFRITAKGRDRLVWLRGQGGNDDHNSL